MIQFFLNFCAVISQENYSSRVIVNVLLKVSLSKHPCKCKRAEWLVKYIVCWCFGQWLVWQTFHCQWLFSRHHLSSHLPPSSYISSHPPHPCPQCWNRRQIAHRCLLTTDSVQQEVRFIGRKSGIEVGVFITNPNQNSDPRVAQAFCTSQLPFSDLLVPFSNPSPAKHPFPALLPFSLFLHLLKCCLGGGVAFYQTKSHLLYLLKNSSPPVSSWLHLIGWHWHCIAL